MQATCGNCGQPVGGSDITCPHCGVLLAAYSSPMGAVPDSMDHSPTSANAIQSVIVDEATPAARRDIPEEIEGTSSAPTPLFDTNLTIEELGDATVGHSEETLLVLNEDDAVSVPAGLENPDRAQPPVEVGPVPVIEESDQESIADPSEGDEIIQQAVEPHVPEPFADETIPAERQQTDGPTSERAEFWKDFPTNNYDEVKRSPTTDFLREVDEEAILASLPKWMTKHLETSQTLANEAVDRKDKPWSRWENEDGEPPTIIDLVSTILFIVVFALVANNSIGFDALIAVTLLLMFLPLIGSLWKSWVSK